MDAQEATGEARHEPWLRDGAEVAADLGTDACLGLTPAEAAARLDTYGPNRLQSAPPVPAWRRFLAQFANALIYLLVGAVIVSLVA